MIENLIPFLLITIVILVSTLIVIDYDVSDSKNLASFITSLITLMLGKNFIEKQKNKKKKKIDKD